MGIDEGDSVIAVEMSDGKEQIFLGTRDGMAIRFDETDVRPMGRTAYGVRGISLRDDDEVVAMDVVREGGTLLTVAQNGYGKRTELEEYRLQSRGGVGIINIQTSDRNGKVVGIAYVHDDDELMIISQQGMILRMRAGDVRAIGRATQGVRLIEMEEGDEVVAIAKLAEKEVENGDEPAAAPEATAGRRADRSAGLQRGRPGVRRLRRLQLRVLRQQLLHADQVEAHGDLQVVVVLFDRHHRADAELRVPHAHAGPQRLARLIFFLVLVGLVRLRATRPAPLPFRPYGFVRNS